MMTLVSNNLNPASRGYTLFILWCRPLNCRISGRGYVIAHWWRGVAMLEHSADRTLLRAYRDRLVGLVVKASASRAEDPGFESRLRRDFSGSSHTSDSKIGTPVATLPGVWRCRVSTGTGRPGVRILWLGEVDSLIRNFYLSVAARKIIRADPSLRYTNMLLGR